MVILCWYPLYLPDYVLIQIFKLGKKFTLEFRQVPKLLALAWLASEFSIAGAFYQAYSVQEKGW